MKKTAFSLALLLGVLVTGCSTKVVTPKKDNGKDVVVDFTPEGSGVSNITADDLYDDFLSGNIGSSLVFDQLYKAIVNKAIDDLDSTSRAILEQEVKQEMIDWVQDAKDQASSNGVSKDVMIDQLLEQEGVKTQKELEKKKLDAKIQTAVEEKYYEQNRGEFIKNYVAEYAPVHIRGILVKITNNSDPLFLRQISETEGKKLLNVFTQLQHGTEFIKLASNSQVSDHAASQLTAGGSLGIMDITTGFNSEFKLGVYSYLASEYPAAEAITRISADSKARNIEVITTADIDALTDAIERKEKDKNGKDIIDSTKKGAYQTSLIARNIVFNQRFNSHSVSYLAATVDTPSALRKTIGGVDVVANKSGDPILVLVDENGVQFIYLENNPFIEPSATEHYYSESADKVYYSIQTEGYQPETKEHFEDVAGVNNDGHIKSMVPFVSQGYNDKSNRKATVDTQVKNFVNKGFTSSISASDTFYKYSIFDKYYTSLKATEDIEGLGTSEKGLKLEAQVLSYMANARANRNLLIADAYEDLWEGLDKTIALQDTFFAPITSNPFVSGALATITHARPEELLDMTWTDDEFEHYSKFRYAGFAYGN
ncbi:MAG: hypothetical protein LBM99_05545 [Bacillales bacterium]|nr:hypothetical protein [Bacillales bacterium]